MTIDDLEPLHSEAFRWALGCCGWDAAEADDVMQIAYLKVLEGRARFDARSSLRTWWFAVVRKTAMDRGRRRRARELLAGRLAREPRPAAARPDGARAAGWTSETRRLFEAMGRISRRQREVVQLVFVHDMTVEQAARTMGISVGAASTHYARGKANLRRLLEQENER